MLCFVVALTTCLSDYIANVRECIVFYRFYIDTLHMRCIIDKFLACEVLM